MKNFKRPRDETATRTLWQWEETDWAGLRLCLAQENWEDLLQGETDQQMERFTEEMGA